MTNLFRIQVNETRSSNVYEYRVIMQPVLKNKERRREIMAKALEVCGLVQMCLFCLMHSLSQGSHYRYDGADLVLSSNDAVPTQMVVYNVQLQINNHGAVRLEDMQDPQVQQMMAVLLAPDANKATQFGNIYASNRGAQTSSSGTELWVANHQSTLLVGPNAANTVINIDPGKIMVFKECPVVQYLNERRLMGKHHTKLEEELKGVKIKFTTKFPTLAHLATQSRVVRGVPDKNCGEMMFLDDQKEKMVSVADYFLEKYKVQLERSLPLLCTRRPDPNQADPHKRSGVYFPMEICVIAGGQRKSHLEPQDVQTLLQGNCIEPNERLRQTTEYARTLASAEMLQKNGVLIQTDPITVMGEVLAPAQLLMGKTGRIQEKRMQPVFDFRDAHFFQPATITKWNIVVMDRKLRPNDLRSAMTQQFPKCFRMLNVIIPGQPDQVVVDVRDLRLSPEDKNVVTFVVLESTDSTTYLEVKKFFDDRSFTSQCMQSSKMFSRGTMNVAQSYAFNICYKVNSKLFGVNVTLGPESHLCAKLDRPPTMVVGFDCHHPPVGVSSASMGCCVASLDNTLGMFAAEFLSLPSRMELHAPLAEPLRLLMDKYRKKNKSQMPPSILMFRDGVGQSQVDAVRAHEIPMLRDVFGEVPLTVVMATKRHHIRLYKMTDGDEVGNPDAGTLVNCEIVRDNSFILCSHAPALGTSHPTMYEIILNDNPAWDLRAIVEMTRDLCYLNPRATKAGSVPVPITHAHLAATRARKYETDSVTASSLRDIEGCWWL